MKKKNHMKKNKYKTKNADLHFLILLFTEFTIAWTVGTKKINNKN